MDTTAISQMDILDILFRERNKSYGAYNLRKTYNKRLAIALGGMLCITLLVTGYRTFSVRQTLVEQPPVIDTGDYVVHNIPEDDPVLPPDPPKATQPPARNIETAQFTNIRIVKDNEVIMPPVDMEQIQTAMIDVNTHKGDSFDGKIQPPDEPEGTNVIATPVKEKRNDEPLIIVEKDASFPGGADAWRKYVEKSVLAASDGFEEADYGTVVVKFVVDTDGRVSEVQATTMKGTRLAEIAVNAIQKGPAWIPAMQNGRYVKAWRLQPVTILRPN
ncbi:MAG: energy transducer TonB [Chitinophagaceae bacterium]|nr:energy transducer TonB [Chitinophagaceae bacterium]